jgi:hypothetical protein
MHTREILARVLQGQTEPAKRVQVLLPNLRNLAIQPVQEACLCIQFVFRNVTGQDTKLFHAWHKGTELGNPETMLLL